MHYNGAMTRRPDPVPPEPSAEPKALGDYLTTAVLWLDPGGRLVYMNPAAEDLLAVSPIQAAGVAIGEILPEAESLHALVAQATSRREVCTARELMLSRPGDASELLLDCTISPVIEGRNELTGFLVEMRSENRHARISRDVALVSQRRALQGLARGLAHEIRNPLGGLRGAAQLLEQKADGHFGGGESGASGLREYTGVIIREADRLAALVDTLLGPAREPRRRITNLHEPLEHVARLVTAEFEGVRVERDYDPSLPEAVIDPELTIQALLNIARNGCQAMDGEGRLRLRTRVLRQYTIGDRRHRLAGAVEIEDEGPGVPEPVQATLFYPLVSGRTGGTGLGLAIAQDLIQRQGGLIEFETRPGRTIFRLNIPLEEDGKPWRKME